jgi:preprotein translocase subunit SecD
MNKNLTWKLVVIVGILLVFLAGIFGIPKDWSGKGILASISDRIHLGLDLRGGTHLILQVQVNDAVNVDSDNAIARLKEDMRARKINYADITKPDPVNHPEMIVIKGIPPEQASDFKSIVSDRLPDYSASSGAENSWTVSMKAQNLADLKNRAVTQAIETIRNRIDQLGVSEPVIQEHGLGQYQILVQLPGVDDPARVKEIMQSTAMLEIKQSLGGPYSSEQQALQEHGGVLPPDAVLMPGKSIGSRNTEGGEAWYLISRASAVTGRDLRTAEPSTDENGQPAVRFILTSEGGRKFYSFTSTHVGDNLAVVLDNKVQEVAVIKDAIRDTGVINGRFTQQETQDLSIRRSAGGHQVPGRAYGRAIARRRFDSFGSARGHLRHARRPYLYVGLLPLGGRKCRYRADPESGHPARLHGLLRSGADAAGHCRRDPDGWHGRRFERPDF